MSATDDDNDNSMSCANCGKEGNNLNICNRCKLVKYCNAACKKKHRSKHKKKCDRRVAELHDEALFKQPPQKEDCPICFMRKPTLHSGSKYYSCCGKVICSGCVHAPVYGNNGNKVEKKCPFCRALAPETDEEDVKQMQKRVEVGDAQAMDQLGYCYSQGSYGLPQDWNKALELWHRAGELGIAKAYCNIGFCYFYGRGVERDEKKATHYWELAAIGGNTTARHNLGLSESNAGNFGRALKHYMINVEGGSNDSLKRIKQMFSNGHGTKDAYSKALLSYQSYLGEIKSDQRDKAAEYSDNYKYYE